MAVVAGTLLSTLLLAGQPQLFEFRWAFMPTYSMFRTVVLHPPSDATHFNLSLTSNLTGVIPINSTGGPMSLINTTVGFNWEVKPLRAPGNYTLSLLCLSADAHVVHAGRVGRVHTRDGVGRDAQHIRSGPRNAGPRGALSPFQLSVLHVQ